MPKTTRSTLGAAILALASVAACGSVEDLFTRGRQSPPDVSAQAEPVGGHHPQRVAHAAPATPAAPPDDANAPKDRARGAGLAALHVDGAQLVTDDKRPVQLHGFNWFGFNTGTGAPDGLWTADPVGGDFARTVHRAQMLGFNAVRLPFSFAEFPKAPRPFSFACPDVSTADLAKLTVDPEVQSPAGQPPELAAPPKREAGQCNGYLPGNTTRERFLWAVKFLVDNGFYVLVDNHFREDRTAEQDQAAWVRSWADLAHELQTPEFVGRVFFDLLNEPAQYGQMWHKTDKAGVQGLYLAAMDAIEHEAPEAIFFIEGTGQDALGANWGDGFCTDEGKVKAGNLSDPRPFFTELAGKPYHNRVVLAPHVYGPAVTFAHDKFGGPGLVERLDASFGALGKAGFEAGQAKLLLPHAIGEFGSKFMDAGDQVFMKDFAAYLQGGASHPAPAGWFYWCWNANSGDTGGLVQDDFKEIQWAKIRYLEGLGLRPWYRGAAAPAESPPPSGGVPPASGLPAATSGSASTAAKPTPDASPPAATASAAQSAPAKQNKPPSPAPAEQVVRPPAAPAQPPRSHPLLDVKADARAQSRAPAPPPAREPGVEPSMNKSGSTAAPQVPPPVTPRDGRLHAQVAINSWRDGSGWMHAAQIHLANATQAPIRIPFEISFSGPQFVAIGQSWGVEEMRLDGKFARGRVTADWASLPPSGRGTGNMGFIYRTQGEDKAAWQINVAGQPCAVGAS